MSTFVDTNVLVCARDAGQPQKQPVARQWLDRLWDTATGRLSAQVLHEYYVTVTRKLEPGMSQADARADVRDLLTWKPLPISGELTSQAWTIEDQFDFSFWDALIVAAAQAANCRHLLTEDLQDGQDLDGVVVVNPFIRDPDAYVDT